MNSFLSGLILFSSFAMRTPNDDTIKKDDYELSLGFKSKTIYYKRDWERELGEHYIDDLFWAKFDNGMYFRKTVWIHGNKYISAEMSNSFKRRATALKFFSNAKSKIFK